MAKKLKVLPFKAGYECHVNDYVVALNLTCVEAVLAERKGKPRIQA